MIVIKRGQVRKEKGPKVLIVMVALIMPEVGFEFGVVSAQVVQFLVGLQCFRRQAESGIMEPEQLCNSHMAVGAGQIQRTMTHVILQRRKRRSHEKRKVDSTES